MLKRRFQVIQTARRFSMFVQIEYLQELSGGIPFAGLACGAAVAGMAGNGDQGRNHKLKGIVAAALEAGENFTTFMQGLIQFDERNGNLFSDTNDPQMKGGDRQSNALRFVSSVVKSINGKRLAAGLPVQEFRLGDDTTTCTPADTAGFIKLTDFHASRFVGTPPAIRWAVEPVFKRGAAYMFAGMGEIGKGFLTLQLANSIAFDRGYIRSQAFGGTVTDNGTAVIISCEDSAETYHQRIADLDPDGGRFKHPDKLILVSLADAGGTRPFVVSGKGGFETTAFYKDIRQQLLAIPDLRLIVFDTMQGLFQCDFNSDPAAGQYCAGVLQELATVTDSAVLTPHHMRKPSSEITTPLQAREAIRGTTAIVDGLRGAYALWPCPDKEARRIAADLGIDWQSNLIVKGAIVKSNSAESRNITTFIRNEFGLLEDRTHDLRRHDPEELLSTLVDAIRQAAAANTPFFKSGSHGVFQRRKELPADLAEIARHKLEKMVDELETQGRIFIDSKAGISC
jgi:hypothetical protein